LAHLPGTVIPGSGPVITLEKWLIQENYVAGGGLKSLYEHGVISHGGLTG
jgi:hypothetical protein